ncbi:MAG: hypothetical protein IPH81_15050 [Candidatus Microthrix sp.]|nr:hypothetical protein [Candidatus Microthrix sp.]
MTSERRIVRTLPSFFNDVDRQFPPERGSNGEPSAVDFQSYDLLEVVELLLPASTICRNSLSAVRIIG